MSYQAIGLVLTLFATTCSLAAPLLMKWLIDDILPNRRWDALVTVTALFFIVYISRSLLSSLSYLVNTLGVERLVLRLRNRLLRHLLTLPATFYGKRPVGDLMQRLEQDVSMVSDAGSSLLPAVVRVLVDTVMTAAAMVFLDWRLSVVVVPLLPLFAYVQQRYRTILRRRAEEVREVKGQQSSLLNELLAGALQIQMLGAEHRLWRRYSHLSLQTLGKDMRQRRSEVTYSGLVTGVVGLGTALILGYGGMRVLTGGMTAGSLVAFYSYIGQIFSPMSTALDLYARLARVRASVRRLMELEEEPSTIVDAPDAVPVKDAPEVVVCTDVSFDYGPDKATLRRIDFDARAGERVAVVGESGCGKSSLLKLIPRLYDVADGRVEIDGRNVRALQLRTLRRAVSFVPQDPILFRGTLRDNLKHGHPSATPHDIAQAAHIACLTEVVAQLAKGWDTELGPMGVGLSGGERQRLALARALLQRRPILILDEATSALDPPTEYRLLSRLASWCAGRIVIVVSHRLAAARWADRVVVLHQGEVVEDGTHASLYQPGTQYYSLWQRPGNLTAKQAERTSQSELSAFDAQRESQGGFRDESLDQGPDPLPDSSHV